MLASGANLPDKVALFEATHGTAPKSQILSAEMMLRHMGWNEAADLIVKGFMIWNA